MSVAEAKIASQIERAGFELRTNMAGDAATETINVDADCFIQMIINLVDNAIKFSKNAESKIIELSCKRGSNNRILFSVRDHGPGVATDQMKNIFQLFYRSESELTRETVGTGIGLAIVHQLAVAMDGGVDMVNASPGAEFRFWFSVSP
jgi:signal transduction histidine kinase